ncbi:MAG: type II toxin-antitoxin system HicB family antitoxin [Chloroflexi bacterium]|nr:type II toxin-antitoxin system HicB family antitoxin [Chloroflexota bacterium]
MIKSNGSLREKVEYYANLPYTVFVEPRDDGKGTYFVARVVELPDLLMTGNTVEEAVQELEAVKHEWIESFLTLGNKMPLPLKSRHYSGKVILRMPPSLHESLMFQAEKEGVSLNQYLVASLSHTLGFKAGVDTGTAFKSKTRKQRAKTR